MIGEPIKDKQVIERALTGHHNKSIKIIHRLGKRDKGLIKICENNTKFSFNKRNGTKKTLPAFNSLKEELDLQDEIKFIESYDISHHSGSAAIGGCVVFSERGKQKEKQKERERINEKFEATKEARMPWFCPKCDKVMKKRLDDKMWFLHDHCFDCQLEIEHKMRLDGF